MEKYNVARNYAESLYSVVEDKKTGLIFLKKMVNLVNDFEDFRLMLLHPHIKEEIKIEMIKRVFKIEIKKSHENFLKLIINHHRVEYIEDIYNEFLQIYNHFFKVQPVEIFVASEIKDKLLQSLKTVLSKKLNRKIVFKVIIDKNLIGGIKIKVGDKIYDGSIKNRLESFKNKIFQEAI